VVEYLKLICCKFTAELASENKFENRIIVGEVMAKSLVSCFILTHCVAVVVVVVVERLRTGGGQVG